MTWRWSGDHRRLQEGRVRREERSRDASLLRSQLRDAPALPVVHKTTQTNPLVIHNLPTLLPTCNQYQHALAEQYVPNVSTLHCMPIFHMTGSRMQGTSAQHLPSLCPSAIHAWHLNHPNRAARERRWVMCSICVLTTLKRACAIF